MQGQDNDDDNDGNNNENKTLNQNIFFPSSNQICRELPENFVKRWHGSSHDAYDADS
jgi:hypothetical protein